MNISSLTIAIPAYNEEATIHSVIKDALNNGGRVTKKLEILIVDDGSTDKTLSIIKLAEKNDKRIRIIQHKHNKGFSGAIRSCYRESKSDWIFLAPADGQIKLNILPIFIQKAADADIIVGYRTKNPESFSRKINSWIFHHMYRFLFGVKLHEISTAILWKRSVLHTLKTTALDRSALIQPELIYEAWKANYTFAEVGFEYNVRTAGKAKGADPTMMIMTFFELLRLRFFSTAH